MICAAGYGVFEQPVFCVGLAADLAGLMGRVQGAVERMHTSSLELIWVRRQKRDDERNVGRAGVSGLRALWWDWTG